MTDGGGRRFVERHDPDAASRSSTAALRSRPVDSGDAVGNHVGVHNRDHVGEYQRRHRRTGQTDFTGKEVSVPYTCKTPIGDKNATSPVQINATKNGGSYGLTVKFNRSVMDSPADIPADSVKPSMEVVLGGADKGTVKVEGPTNRRHQVGRTRSRFPT